MLRHDSLTISLFFFSVLFLLVSLTTIPPPPQNAPLHVCASCAVLFADDDVGVILDDNDDIDNDDDDIVSFVSQSGGGAFKFNVNAKNADMAMLSSRRSDGGNAMAGSAAAAAAMASLHSDSFASSHSAAGAGHDMWYNLKFSELLKCLNAANRYECPRSFCHKSYKDASSLQRHIRCVRVCVCVK